MNVRTDAAGSLEDFDLAQESPDVVCTWDSEAGVWVAVCGDVPLVLESEPIDTLINRIEQTAPEILALNREDESVTLNYRIGGPFSLRDMIS